MSVMTVDNKGDSLVSPVQEATVYELGSGVL